MKGEFKMKKILIAAITALALNATLSAQSVFNHVDFGVRGMIDVNTGTTLDFDGSYLYEQETVVGYGATLFANIPIPAVRGLGIQPELALNLNNGVSYSLSETLLGARYTATRKFVYNSIDIPLLITYTMNFDKFELIPLGGVYISIPISKLNLDYVADYDGSSSNITAEFSLYNKFLWGMTLGCSAAYKLNDKFAIIADIRYIFDSESIILEDDSDEDLFTRHQFQFSAGLKYSL